MQMHASARGLLDEGQPRGSHETLFVIGLSVVVVVPLSIAIGVAWYYIWSQPNESHAHACKVSAQDDSESEEERLRPDRRKNASHVLPRDRRRCDARTPIYFRTADWSSCNHRPLVSSLVLKGIHSLPVRLTRI